MQEHRSNPSIGIYTVFNEGWGQYDTQRLVQEAKALDPSRLWDAASGWIDPQDGTAYPAGGQTTKSGINHPGPWMYHYVGYVRPNSPACISFVSSMPLYEFYIRPDAPACICFCKA